MSPGWRRRPRRDASVGHRAATVQFGWVEPGGTKLSTIKLRNDGNAPLVIWSLTEEGAFDGVGLTNPPALPLNCSSSTTWGSFRPIEEHAMDGDPLRSWCLSRPMRPITP